MPISRQVGKITASGSLCQPESGLYFETGYLLIQAAIAGQGVALERAALVNSSIKAGKLVKAYNLSLHEVVNGYYLVFSENRIEDPKIKNFLKWLNMQVAL
jgi:LysR family glycine cleavage system transcriptional activator